MQMQCKVDKDGVDSKGDKRRDGWLAAERKRGQEADPGPNEPASSGAGEADGAGDPGMASQGDR